MPSPDVRPYYDLTIYDKDPQDVFEAALMALQTHLPEWVPREGNTEVLLLEALALEVAETVFAINRLPSGIVEVLLRLFGIERDSGAAPVVDLRFTMAGTVGYTIPAQTQLRMMIPGGTDPVMFLTQKELIISPGVNTGVVSAIGDRFTSDANNIALGTPLELMDSLVHVDTVTLDAITAPGRDPEDQSTYFTRALARFSRLSDTLVVPDHFEKYVLEKPEFYRARAIDNWNGSDGEPGDHPGHITVAVYGNGGAVGNDAKAALEAEMNEISLANLAVHVIDPVITPVDVTVTVKARKGYPAEWVENAIQNTLIEYLNPQTWGWGSTVRRFELVSLIDQVPGVDYIEALDDPADDVVLNGYAPLAEAGVLTVMVNEA